MAADSGAPRNVELIGSIDQAFLGNRLLAAFDGEARALIEPHAELITLSAGDISLTPGRS